MAGDGLAQLMAVAERHSVVGAIVRTLLWAQTSRRLRRMPISDRVTLLTRLLDRAVRRTGRTTAERQIADFYRRTQPLFGSSETETETCTDSAASRDSVSWSAVREMLVRKIVAVWGYDGFETTEGKNRQPSDSSAKTTMSADHHSTSSSATSLYPFVHSPFADDSQADVHCRSTNATLRTGEVDDARCDENCSFAGEYCARDAVCRTSNFLSAKNSATEAQNISDSPRSVRESEVIRDERVCDVSQHQAFKDNRDDSDRQLGFTLEDDSTHRATGEVVQVPECELGSGDRSNVEVTSADSGERVSDVIFEEETSFEDRQDDDDDKDDNTILQEEALTNATDHVTRWPCSPMSDRIVRLMPQTSSDCADVEMSATESQVCDDVGVVQEQNELTDTDHVTQQALSFYCDVSEGNADHTDQSNGHSVLTLTSSDQRSENVSDVGQIQLAQNCLKQETDYAATNFTENG